MMSFFNKILRNENILKLFLQQAAERNCMQAQYDEVAVHEDEN